MTEDPKQAKVAYLQAKTAKEKQLARTAKATADAAEIDRDRANEKRAKELVSDYENRVYRFHTDVNPSTAAKCRSTLAEWHRLDPGCDIEIQFLSPGGSVTDGLALFDSIQELRRAAHVITTSTIGMAASMAGILLQAGDHRIMGAESWLLIHQAAFMAVGSSFQVEDKAEWIKRIEDRILDIFAARAAASDSKKPLTKLQIKRRWHRKDWWISSDEAIKYGFVDEVR